MTSAYYLRYGIWNSPQQDYDKVDFSTQSQLFISPACRIVHVLDQSLQAQFDFAPIVEKLQSLHGNSVLFPDSGIFKFDKNCLTLLNSRYEPSDSNLLEPGLLVKIKFVPSIRKLPSGEMRCDFFAFDILQLEK